MQSGGLKVSTYKMQDREIKVIDVAFYFDCRSKSQSIKIYRWQVGAVCESAQDCR